MIHCLSVGFLAGVLGAPLPPPGLAADTAAEPPRLKKKEKRPAPPAPEEKSKPAPPKATEWEDEPVRGGDPGEVQTRLLEDFRTAEERLAKQDAGEGTQQVQRDILKNLDAYIDQARRQQQQQSASRSSANRQARQQSTPKEQTAQGASKSRGQPDGTVQMQGGLANGGGGAKEKGKGMNKIADLYKDVWGHLPETLRQEMDQYSREQFMAKYGDLLKQYYATIAEKGRRKGGE